MLPTSKNFNAPKCKICYARYNEDQNCPIVTKCGHTFCMRCYSNIVNGSQREGSKCPDCRVPIQAQKEGPTKNFELLTAIRDSLLYEECEQHENRPLVHLCLDDEKYLCDDCILASNGSHENHTHKTIDEAKAQFEKHQKELEKTQKAWSDYNTKFVSLLEKRKNDQLDEAFSLFDKLEETVKKRKLDLGGKIVLTFEHEKNRLSSLLDPLQNKIAAYQKNDPKSLSNLYNNKNEEISLMLDPTLIEDKFQNFGRELKEIGESFKTTLLHQQQKVISIDFSTNLRTQDPPECLPLFDDIYNALHVSPQLPFFNVKGRLSFWVKDDGLEIGQTLKINEDSIIDVETWKSVKQVKFWLSRLDFSQEDFLILQYVFHRLSHIESIKLFQIKKKQELEQNIPEIIDAPSGEKVENLIKLMGILYLNKPKLTSLTFLWHHGIEGAAALQALGAKILPNLNKDELKSLEVKVLAMWTLGNPLINFINSLGQWGTSLESLMLKIPGILSYFYIQSTPLKLFKLKHLNLEIACRSTDYTDIEYFVNLSVGSMKELEGLDIKLFNCQFQSSVFNDLFNKIEDTRTLKTLSVEIQPQQTVIQRQPAVTRPQPGIIQPQLTGIQPQLTGTQSQLTGIQPQLTGTQPQLTGIQPQLTRIQPQLTRIQPQLSRIQPQLTGTQPQLTGIQPQPNGITSNLATGNRAPLNNQIVVANMVNSVREQIYKMDHVQNLNITHGDASVKGEGRLKIVSLVGECKSKATNSG